MGIDTCTTATLSGCRSDFIGEIKPIQGVQLKGVGGTLPVVGRGTFLFNFLDDHGQEQQLKVEDAYYVPRLKLRLFSPQQWSRQGPRYRGGTHVRGEITRGDTTKLFFKGGTKTIHHDKHTGLPILHSTPSHKAFAHFVTTMNLSTYEARFRLTPSVVAEDPYLPKPNTMDLFDSMPLLEHTHSTTKLADIPGETKRDQLLRWHY